MDIRSTCKYEKKVLIKSKAKIGHYKFDFCGQNSSLFPSKPWIYITRLEEGRHLIVMAPGYIYDIP